MHLGFELLLLRDTQIDLLERPIEVERTEAGTGDGRSQNGLDLQILCPDSRTSTSILVLPANRFWRGSMVSSSA